jgi:poly-gamma-glutamate synthesis protein (capsule biosynthesis protein)
LTSQTSDTATGRRTLARLVVFLFIIAVGFTAMMFLANSLRDVVSTRHPALPEIPPDGPIAIALAGDTSLVTTAPVSGPSADLANLIRRATLGFTNLELTIEEPRRDSDRPLPPGRGQAAPAATADALRALGFDVVSLANNHALDFGPEGLTGTITALDGAGVVHAGAGDDLAAASAPAYVGTDRSRRVAFVAVAASASADSFASPSQSDIQGRPGVNPLRYVANVTVDADTFRTLAASVVPMHAGPPPTDRELVMFGQRITRGDRTSVTFTVDEQDRARALDAVRAARAQAAIVIVSIHSHEPFNGSDVPADFVTAFAHDAIEAGAQIVVGHGPHRIRGMERYRDGAIFYSLGHYSFDSGVIDLRSADAFDAGHNLYAMTMGAGAEQSSASAQLEAERWWEGLLVTATFEGGSVTGIAVHPVVLDRRELNGRSVGLLALAEAERADSILRRFSALSTAAGQPLPFEPAEGGYQLRYP